MYVLWEAFIELQIYKHVQINNYLFYMHLYEGLPRGGIPGGSLLPKSQV